MVDCIQQSVDDWCYEVPASGISPGLMPEEVAHRKLQEGVGGCAADLRCVGQFRTSNGICNTVAYAYLATTIVVETGEDAFHAFVPASLGYRISGLTVEEACANIAEAMQLYIGSMQQSARTAFRSDCRSGLEEERIMLDLLIRDGRIVDGTGNPWFRGSVGVSDGRIVAVGRSIPAHAEQTIEANDLIVAPGFIDIHAHSDYTLLVDGRATSKIMQGVTTECNGNCGVSAAPAPEHKPYYGPLDANTTTGLVCDWESYDEYQARLTRQGVAANTIGLIGHGNIRHAVMKYEDRPPTPSEMDEMKRLVAEAMEQGAFGMSTGLMYTPGSYTTTEELVDLCKVIASFGGVYTTHTRGLNETMVDAVAEAIDIGHRSGAPVHISHLNPAPPMFGLTVQLLQMIDEARAEGIDVTTDVMPYTIGSTALKAMCPPWAEEGGVERFLERLKDPVQRAKIKADTLTYGSISGGSCKRALIKQGQWDVIWLVSAEMNVDLVGKSFAEIADIRGQDPFDAMLDILWEEGANCQMRAQDKDPEDIERVLRYPYAGVQSDGFAVVPEGVLGRGQHHPRLYGTFARLLGHYVRGRKVLRLEEAVRKVTSFPALRFGIRDRGQITEGAWADLVIFDEARIIDRSTFEDPYQYPDGIEWVIVNGQVTVERGTYHPTLAGQTLRHS